MATRKTQNINVEGESVSKESRQLKANEKFKTEKCRVSSYNKTTKELDIDFFGYGIRICNVDVDFEVSDTIEVKYRGEIGKPNFICRL